MALRLALRSTHRRILAQHATAAPAAAMASRRAFSDRTRFDDQVYASGAIAARVGGVRASEPNPFTNSLDTSIHTYRRRRPTSRATSARRTSTTSRASLTKCRWRSRTRWVEHGAACPSPSLLPLRPSFNPNNVGQTEAKDALSKILGNMPDEVVRTRVVGSQS